MITNNFERDFALKMSYSVRDDRFAKGNDLQLASVANEVELAGKWHASDNSDLQWSVIGRQLDIRDQTLLPNDKSKKTILGRIDYSFSVWNEGIRSVTSYNTNSGQEPKIEYIFQKVEVDKAIIFISVIRSIPMFQSTRISDMILPIHYLDISDLP